MPISNYIGEPVYGQHWVHENIESKGYGKGAKMGQGNTCSDRRTFAAMLLPLSDPSWQALGTVSTTRARFAVDAVSVLFLFLCALASGSSLMISKMSYSGTTQPWKQPEQTHVFAAVGSTLATVFIRSQWNGKLHMIEEQGRVRSCKIRND